MSLKQRLVRLERKTGVSIGPVVTEVVIRIRSRDGAVAHYRYTRAGLVAIDDEPAPETAQQEWP